MKKKAIKLAAASAVAASAFVASAPAQTNAATNVAAEVSKAVTQIKKAYHTYSDVTAKGQFADIKEVYKQYNAAKVAYNNAKALVNKAGGSKKDAYLAQLDSTYADYITKRVVTYIDAYNYAKKLEEKKVALEKAIADKKLEDAEKYYNEISYELNKRTVILDRVYGKTTRDLLRAEFKTPAQDVRDSLKYDITVAVKLRAADEAIKKGDLTTAADALKVANDNLPKVTETFKAQLTAEYTRVKAAYDAALAPKVESVSAINLNQIKITFNKELDKESAETLSNYDVVDKVADASILDTTGTGLNAASVKLQDDKKSVIINLDSDTAADLTKDKTYKVTVKKLLKFADGKTLADNYVTEFVAKDAVAPKVKSITPTSTGFTVEFDEPVKQSVIGVVKVNNISVPAASITPVAGSKTKFDVAYNATAGQSYQVYVGAFEDRAGNQNEAYNTTLTFNKDVVAPVLQSITQDGDLKLKLKFSEELAPGTTATVYRGASKFATNATLVQDTDDKTVYYVTLSANDGAGVNLYPTGTSTTTVSVDLTQLKDAAGNLTAAQTTTVTLNRTVVAPQALSITYNGTNAIVKFDKDLDRNSIKDAKLLITDATGAEVTGVTGTVVKDAAGTALGAQDAGGKYLKLAGLPSNKKLTLNFLAGYAKDLSVVPNETVAFTLSLDTSVNANDAVAPKLLGSQVTAGPDGENVITLTFDKTLAASSKDLSNFKLDGSALPTGSVAVLTTSNPGTSPDNDSIKITLPTSATPGDGNYALTYSNIKDLAGNTATTATKVVVLKDTVKPVLQSAKIKADTNEVILTFSEGIKDSTLANANTDFEVKVNGVKLTSGYTVAAEGTANDNVIKITFTGVNVVSQNVTVSTIDNPTTVTDNSSNANKLKGGVLVTATN